MPRSYPPEFRRKVLDLVAAGRPIKQVAEMLGISDQTIYNWRRQHLRRLYTGVESGGHGVGLDLNQNSAGPD